MQKIREATSTLNRISDEAAIAVQSAEAFLAECGVGIVAKVEVTLPPANADSEPRSTRVDLLYDPRYSGKPRIIVSEGDDRNDVTKPWAEWDRTTKLVTVKSLPKLLDRIMNQVAIDARIAEEASTAIAMVLASVGRKGAK
jgi:hypothetical protein